jgi:hypothetical protein
VLPSEVIKQQVEAEANKRASETFTLALGLLHEKRFRRLRRRLCDAQNAQEVEYMLLIFRYEELIKLNHRKDKRRWFSGLWTESGITDYSDSFEGSHMSTEIKKVKAKITRIEVDAGVKVSTLDLMNMRDVEFMVDEVNPQTHPWSAYGKARSSEIKV